MALTISRPARPPAPPPKRKKFAVLIDGSALYSSSRSSELGLRGSDDRRLNYPALTDVLIRKVEGLTPSSPSDESSVWTMWTSASPGNTGQSNFLEFTEQRLKWQVRRVLPRDALMIEPAALFIPTDAGSTIVRLSRFDAAIAFAMGRLAGSHQIVVISDSYPLCDPLRRINERWEQELGKCYVAFFGHSMENRWGGALKGENAPIFIDLDEFEAELFGIDRKEVTRPVDKTSKLYF